MSLKTLYKVVFYTNLGGRQHDKDIVLFNNIKLEREFYGGLSPLLFSRKAAVMH